MWIFGNKFSVKETAADGGVAKEGFPFSEIR